MTDPEVPVPEVPVPEVPVTEVAPWIAEAAAEAGVHPLRLHPLNPLARSGPRPGAGAPVLYWMQNAQRAADNPALDLGAAVAGGSGSGVTALFVLDSGVPYASARTFSFLLDGLAALPAPLRRRRVPFAVRCGSPPEEVARAAAEIGAGVVVTDLSPLQRGRRLRRQAGDLLAGAGVGLVAVDTEHVVPLLAVPGEQWAARSLRPRFWRWLGAPVPKEGGPVPSLPPLPAPIVAPKQGVALDGLALTRTGRESIMHELRVDPDVTPVADLPGGEPAAAERLEAFVAARLEGYGSGRSGGQADLTDERTSRLSAYLRYGQISPWRVAHQVATAKGPEPDRASFLEEVLIRRELGANFCWFNPRYRSLAGLPTWARETLRRHAGDRRAFTYSTAEFEQAATHDPLWNAAQRQLVREGRIHNYLRMYWGKMILAWSATPPDALRTALRLNDRYGLDGRSANGYTNVLWCFGKHDRPWAERPVFGTVRFMAAAGVERKFRTEPYLAAFGP